MNRTSNNRPLWITNPRPRSSQEREQDKPEARPARFRWGAVICLALLGGVLVFCHGCHSHVDDELFANDWWMTAIR